MKRNFLFQLFAGLLFFSFSACQIIDSEAAEEEVPLTGAQWLAYSEIQCGGNPWGYCNTNPDTEVCVKKYVQDQGFTVLEMAMAPAPAGLIVCEACHCPSGRTFNVRVQEQDVTKLLAVGFKKVV
ncbi:hypothetical protein [Rufibacter sp. XAAS-G3-1]|uniref:hypothetical protein n=1 Tax=Rufibacter sp. XAAS-G3-1 TaxID=2729134 RepID=UPI0015E79851|nr:hypothetical protein [Rufibacter sp. XAAS-G3-1]